MKNLLRILAILTVVSLLAACGLSDWLTYTNTTYQFQFQYPPGSTIVTDTPLAARIQLPITAGTKLAEKFVDVSVEQGAIPCLSPYSGWWSTAPIAPATSSQTIAGNAWTIESGSEGAAGSFYKWTAYSTYNAGFCVSLTFVLHTQNVESSLTPLPAFDETSESFVFPLIVASFKWLIPDQPPPDATSTPTPASTFTPTPVPFYYYFVPKFNANCRAGPDPAFSSISLAMEGQSYPIDGRNLENTWLYIMITPQIGCWVPLEDGSPSADTTPVRVLADIPTPIPPVILDCSQFTDPQTCAQQSECTWNRLVVPGVCQSK